MVEAARQAVKRTPLQALVVHTFNVVVNYCEMDVVGEIDDFLHQTTLQHYEDLLLFGQAIRDFIDQEIADAQDGISNVGEAVEVEVPGFVAFVEKTMGPISIHDRNHSEILVIRIDDEAEVEVLARLVTTLQQFLGSEFEARPVNRRELLADGFHHVVAFFFRNATLAESQEVQGFGQSFIGGVFGQFFSRQVFGHRTDHLLAFRVQGLPLLIGVGEGFGGGFDFEGWHVEKMKAGDSEL